MERVFFFSMQVEPEHRQELLDALTEHGRICVQTEPGTLRFDVLEDDADPNALYLYEAYTNEAALMTHRNGGSHINASLVLSSLRERGKVTSAIRVRMHSLFTPLGAA